MVSNQLLMWKKKIEKIVIMVSHIWRFFKIWIKSNMAKILWKTFVQLFFNPHCFIVQEWYNCMKLFCIPNEYCQIYFFVSDCLKKTENIHKTHMHTVCIVYLHMYIYNIQDLKEKKIGWRRWSQYLANKSDDPFRPVALTRDRRDSFLHLLTLLP